MICASIPSSLGDEPKPEAVFEEIVWALGVLRDSVCSVCFLLEFRGRLVSSGFSS